MSHPEENIGSCREEINRVDNDLLELLFKRREIVRAVIETKVSQDLPLRDPVREADLLDRLIRDGRKIGLDVHFVTRVFHEIIEDSVRYQESVLQENLNPTTERVLCIAFQGILGAYSHLAAEKFFAEQLDSCNFEGYKTFSDVVAAVENGQADLAMLPIENTTAGSINGVYDLLLSTKLSIVGEEVFSVEHCLLAPKKVPVSSIRRIYSHYQALAQCSDFIGRLKSCEQQSYVDTADSARKVAEDDDAEQASIASEEAGRIYGLEVLKRNLANQPENYTRFVVVAPRSSQVDPRVPCKTSLVMSTAHREGALLESLSILKEYNVNLTKLESRPMQGSPFMYIFYLDFEGNANDAQIQEALVRLSGSTSYLRVLGTYPRQRHERTQPRIQSKLAELPGAADKPEARDEPGGNDAVGPASLPAEGTSTPEVGPRLDADRLGRRETKAADTCIRVRDVEIGGKDLVVIAGPSDVVFTDQVRAVAREVSEYGGGILRASCLEAATSAFRSRRVDMQALSRLIESGREFGLPVLTPIEAVADVEPVARAVDILEVGGRNMQNFGLLEELGKAGRAVVLTRSRAASIETLLEAAECVLAGGNQQVLLCDRGVHTAGPAARTVLDLGSLSTLRQMTHLPVLVDPCHAVERPELIAPLARAARAFGANAVFAHLRTSKEADNTLPKFPISLDSAQFADLMGELFR